MLDRKLIDKLKKIADTFGFDEQTKQLNEEMAELTVALNKFRRYGKMQREKRRADVVTEIADVYIMLEQMKYFLDCQDEVDKEIEYKIERTLRRISKLRTNNEV